VEIFFLVVMMRVLKKMGEVIGRKIATILGEISMVGRIRQSMNLAEDRDENRH
jgi:hypothetical protein